jgi:hypothetical protein
MKIIFLVEDMILAGLRLRAHRLLILYFENTRFPPVKKLKLIDIYLGLGLQSSWSQLNRYLY